MTQKLMLKLLHGYNSSLNPAKVSEGSCTADGTAQTKTLSVTCCAKVSPLQVPHHLSSSEGALNAKHARLRNMLDQY